VINLDFRGVVGNTLGFTQLAMEEIAGDQQLPSCLDGHAQFEADARKGHGHVDRWTCGPSGPRSAGHVVRRQPAVGAAGPVTLWEIDEQADRTRYTFDCDDLTLIIGPPPPSPYTDMVSFVAELATALGCDSA
jgi:hypothetical protein